MFCSTIKNPVWLPKFSAIALAVSVGSISTDVSADGFFAITLPNLHFPPEGAFEERENGNCFLFFCPRAVLETTYADTGAEDPKLEKPEQ